jgi:hypothetical protein
MQMLDQLEITAPPRESQVARSDEQMGIVIAEQRAHFCVKHPMICAGHGFDLIVAADPARAFLAQAGAHAFRIGQDEGIATTPAKQRVEKHRLEKRQRKRIGREGSAPPWRCRDQIKRIHTHPLVQA